METYLRDLMCEQTAQGISASAIVHSSEKRLFTSKRPYNWRGIELAVTYVARWFTLVFAPISPTYAVHLATEIRRAEPDVLHIHMPNASAFWCLVIPSARRLPWVVQWQSDVVSLRWNMLSNLLARCYRLPERLLLRRAKSIIASSPAYLETSKTLQPFLSSCTVVPLAIDATASCDVTRRQPTNGRDKLQVLAVGRLTYYKGFDTLLRAVALSPSIRLTLIGKGEEEESLKNLVTTLGLEERVKLLGECDEPTVTSAFASHDVFCLPSIERTESFGIVLLEAMRQKLPCIATDVPGSGMQWVLDKGKAGFIVPWGNHQALASLFDDLAANRDHLSAMGNAGYERFQSVFSLKKNCRDMSDIYRRHT